MQPAAQLVATAAAAAAQAVCVCAGRSPVYTHTTSCVHRRSARLLALLLPCAEPRVCNTNSHTHTLHGTAGARARLNHLYYTLQKVRPGLLDHSGSG